VVPQPAALILCDWEKDKNSLSEAIKCSWSDFFIKVDACIAGVRK
jgi:hypothetical protein